MYVTEIRELLVLRNFSGPEVWADIETLCPEINVTLKHCGAYFQPSYEFLQEAEPNMVCLDLVSRKPISGDDSHNSTLPNTIISNFIKAFDRFQLAKRAVLALTWPFASESRPDTMGLSLDTEVPGYTGVHEIIEALQLEPCESGGANIL